MTRIRTLVVPVLAAGALLLGGLPPAAAAAAPAAAGCATGWGSMPRSTAAQNPSPLVQVRTGQHPCFDRVVFQIAGSVGAGWDVAYVDAVLADGSGELVPVLGGARLAVVLRHPAHDENGQPTYRADVGQRVAEPVGFQTLRSVVYAGSFEGYTTLGVGTRARLPFRVFALAGPGGDTRIVVDVAHRW
ncbi:MAG: hypothetical protein AVDCRST_MAG66-2428 [uncultured Pseudonocardia sp.]|uniref:AMIN-like domain-containing protein n=1 Tax=uncultured Pseudonocardia sp. TaxID=211455 RepID=A0A6J4PIG7_9PSEU|nr:MAG: hypothetical protein AVDCRST_MAG66-2428 [uncultured Pseudonocardia sp.]